MSLSGNLKTMDLAELLQWLTLGRKTGSLTFIKGKAKNYIYFREGHIISSSSNDPTKYLGQFLLFQGKITESQLRRAVEIQQQTRAQLGRVLVQENFVAKEEVERTLVTRTEEVIYDLFLWEDGFFHFTDDGVNVDDLIVINIDFNAVLFEGVRRKDEWARIRAVFPGNDVTLGLREGVDLRSVELTAMQKKLLFFVNLGKTISEMILELHGSDFLVNFELFQLYDLGVIEVREVREPEPEPVHPDTLLNQGLQLMENKKYQEAIGVFHGILKENPNEIRAHEQIDVAERAICQEYYSNSLAPNKIPYYLVPESSISKYSLTYQEGFVASRINGTWDIKSIVVLSPLREIEILQILDKLMKLGMIGLQ